MKAKLLYLFLCSLLCIVTGCATFNGKVREGQSFRGIFGLYSIYVDGGIHPRDFVEVRRMIQRAEQAYMAKTGRRSPYYYHSINFVDTTNFIRRFSSGGQEWRAYTKGPVMFIHAPTPLIGRTRLNENDLMIALLHELAHMWYGHDIDETDKEMLADDFVDSVPF